ncbi:MAG: EAL domain-containing protein [Pseudomonadota bacterium]
MSLPSCIAEGIETTEQHTCLEELGCHRFQGYLLSKPLNEEQLLAFLQDNPDKT